MADLLDGTFSSFADDLQRHLRARAGLPRDACAAAAKICDGVDDGTVEPSAGGPDPSGDGDARAAAVARVMPSSGPFTPPCPPPSQLIPTPVRAGQEGRRPGASPGPTGVAEPGPHRGRPVGGGDDVHGLRPGVKSRRRRNIALALLGATALAGVAVEEKRRLDVEEKLQSEVTDLRKELDVLKTPTPPAPAPNPVEPLPPPPPKPDSTPAFGEPRGSEDVKTGPPKTRPTKKPKASPTSAGATMSEQEIYDALINAAPRPTAEHGRDH